MIKIEGLSKFFRTEEVERIRGYHGAFRMWQVYIAEHLRITG